MGVTYVPVARVGELAAGAMKEVDLGGRQVLLAFVEGKYFAFSRQCPHEEADLKTGTLEGGKVRCTNHNYCFDLRTGECVLPKGGPPLTVLPAEERGAEVCIRLGVVESQTKCRYSLKNSRFSRGDTPSVCLPVVLVFSRAVDLSPTASLAKLSNKR